MKNIIKAIFAASMLNLRTILARLGLRLKTYASGSTVLLAGNQLAERAELWKQCQRASFANYLSRERMTLIYFSKAKVLNECLDIELLLEKKVIDKRDYLHIYTFFYLDWDSLDSNIQLVKRVIDNPISSEPFVASQQIFNILALGDERTVVALYDHLCFLYENLLKNIEFKVDANHVVENLISLVLFEIFNTGKSQSMKYLLLELDRQCDQLGHKERNVKYSFDMLLKLIAIRNLAIKVADDHQIPLLLSKYIEGMSVQVGRFLSYGTIVHDNINGDAIRAEYERFSGSEIEIVPAEMVSSFPKRGFLGHSFDARYLLGLPRQFKCFGTFQYAEGALRDYQRMRINNAQLCLEKNDQSAFYWKSFRCLGVLPSFVFGKECKRVIELVYSKGHLRILKYEVIRRGKKLEITTKSPLLLRFRVDISDAPAIDHASNVLSFRDCRLSLDQASIIFVKPGLRSTALGVRINCLDIMIKFTTLCLEYT